MCNKEDKDMVVTDAIVEVAVKEGVMPKEQLSNIKSALSEVEQIYQGILPRKTARDFLKERRELK